MGRVSRAQAQEHRGQVVGAAGRLFKERGVGAVSVADLMSEVGLTHGGFYRQFSSKDALLAETVAASFTGLLGELAERDVAHAVDHAAARAALIDYYLSPEHRNDAAGGCPTAGFCIDVARCGDDRTRDAYRSGVTEFARWLTPLEGQDDLQQDDGAVADEGLATLSTMVGALILARAAGDGDLSERILSAARNQLREA